MGNFTALGIRLAVFMLVSLAIGMSVREYARALTAAKLHDPTPRLWGRLTLNPKAWFEPFGSGLVPVLDRGALDRSGARDPGGVRQAGARRPELPAADP